MVINPTRPPLLVAEPGPDWRDSANCATTDPDLFFADNGDHAAVKAARRVCAACHVRAQCLDYALGFPLMPGVWGGTTERERRVLRRERRAAA